MVGCDFKNSMKGELIGEVHYSVIFFSQKVGGTLFKIFILRRNSMNVSKREI